MHFTESEVPSREEQNRTVEEETWEVHFSLQRNYNIKHLNIFNNGDYNSYFIYIYAHHISPMFLLTW